jgi:hypothetical protein
MLQYFLWMYKCFWFVVDPGSKRDMTIIIAELRGDLYLAYYSVSMYI